MADVKIVDIAGEQWNIKDQDARNKIVNLETATSTKSLQDMELNLYPGYTVSWSHFINHYSAGKIHFISIQLINLSGSNIGTESTAFIGSLNIHPIKETTFLLYDYISRSILRCYITASGVVSIGESRGVTAGNNSILGELIFAEE